MIDYYLGDSAAREVTLEIRDNKGAVVRRYSSTDAVALIDPKELKIPPYWVRPPQPLSAEPGLHRFLWDMHYTPIPGVDPEYPIAAIYRNTAPDPTGPWANPGDYSVVLSVDGKSYTQPLTLKMDPRVKASPADLAEQFDLSKRLYELRGQLEPIGKSFDSLNDEIAKAKERTAQNAVVQQVDVFAKRLAEFATPNGRPGAPLTFDALAKVQRLFGALQEVDAAPRPSVKAAVNDVLRDSGAVVSRWQKLVSQDLPALNAELEAAGAGKVEISSDGR